MTRFFLIFVAVTLQSAIYNSPDAGPKIKEHVLLLENNKTGRNNIISYVPFKFENVL